MTANPETATYLAELESYWADAELGVNDGEHMPKPPNPEVAAEVAALCSKAIAGLLDFKKTGIMPGFHTDPSPESQLEASALIDAVHGDVHQAVATALEAADVREQDLQ